MSTAESRLARLACAVLPALALWGCTENLSQDIALVNDPHNCPFGIYVVPGDYYSQPTPNPPRYRFTVDGKFASWDASTYVSLGPGGPMNLTLPAGSHVLGLVDYQDRVLGTGPSMETKPAPDPDNIPFKPWVVFFGDATTMTARLLIDDVAAVPADTTHVRVLNLLADHEPVQIVQCPAAAGGSTIYTASACTPLGDPVAYGDLFEMDASTDVVSTLGFHLAGPGAADPAVIAFAYGYPGTPGSLGSRFITRIPVQVAVPGCPACVAMVL